MNTLSNHGCSSASSNPWWQEVYSLLSSGLQKVDGITEGDGQGTTRTTLVSPLPALFWHRTSTYWDLQMEH